MYGISENSGITIEVLKGLITKRKGFKRFEVNYADVLSIEASIYMEYKSFLEKLHTLCFFWNTSKHIYYLSLSYKYILLPISKWGADLMK